MDLSLRSAEVVQPVIRQKKKYGFVQKSDLRMDTEQVKVYVCRSATYRFEANHFWRITISCTAWTALIDRSDWFNTLIAWKQMHEHFYMWSWFVLQAKYFII